jgi:hypothetical protein
MIDTKLIELLPEQISDEAAYHLVNFMSNLALALENHYFVQLRRYTKNNLERSDL